MSRSTITQMKAIVALLFWIGVITVIAVHSHRTGQAHPSQAAINACVDRNVDKLAQTGWPGVYDIFAPLNDLNARCAVNTNFGLQASDDYTAWLAVQRADQAAFDSWIASGRSY